MTTALIFLPLLLSVVACKKSPSKVEVTDKRELTVWDNPRVPIVPIMPAEWRQVPGTQFRVFNYRFGVDGEAYVSNANGSVLENVNRWLAQYGQEPMESTQELPEITVLGQKGVVVEATGSFTGGMGKLPRENAGLLGVIVDFGGSLLTIKMIGSADAVASENERFIEFCETIQDRDAVMPEDSIKQAPSIPMVERASKIPVPPIPSVSPSSSPSVIPAQPQTSVKTTLKAAVPPEWKEVPGTQFRVLNYTFGSDGEVYVSQSGGGVLPNLNRWLAQYNQAAVSSTDSFEKISLTGIEGILVEIQGKFSGGMGKPPRENAGLLGAMSDKAGSLLTVKMIGDAEEVAAEKERFVEFCKSLEFSP
ncbi:MAG: hypothetical protein ACSHX0_04710 [Akkermansiaceae bacterium]